MTFEIPVPIKNCHAKPYIFLFLIYDPQSYISIAIQDLGILKDNCEAVEKIKIRIRKHKETEKENREAHEGPITLYILTDMCELLHSGFLDRKSVAQVNWKRGSCTPAAA